MKSQCPPHLLPPSPPPFSPFLPLPPLCNKTPFTQDSSRKRHPQALALNCSCSALEFKWPACGFRPLPLPCASVLLMAPRCAAVLYSFMNFLSLFCSLPSLSPHSRRINHGGEQKARKLFWLAPPFATCWAEGSGKAPQYFLFVLFLEMFCLSIIVQNVLLPQCLKLVILMVIQPS